MPNWCSNYLKVEGKKEDILTFLSETTEIREREDGSKYEAFSFQKILPQPEGVDWYRWRNDNWMTKWDSIMGHFEKSDNKLEIGFDTAWNAPYGIYKYLMKKYKNTTLSFLTTYSEEGGYFGYSKFSNGNTEDELSATYHFQNYEEALLYYACKIKMNWIDLDRENLDDNTKIRIKDLIKEEKYNDAANILALRIAFD